MYTYEHTTLLLMVKPCTHQTQNTLYASRHLRYSMNTYSKHSFMQTYFAWFITQLSDNSHGIHANNAAIFITLKKGSIVYLLPTTIVFNVDDCELNMQLKLY